MAKCALQFLLFVAIVSVAAAAATEPGSSHLLEACSKALRTDQLINFCATDFLKDKAVEFTDLNDWKKMSLVVISQGAAKAAAVQQAVADMANNQSLSYFDRAMLNLCLQSVKKGADHLSKAATAFENMEKISEDGLKDVQIMVDNAKSNQGKCDQLIEVKVSLSEVKRQVHDAYLASRIVSKFLFHVRA